MAVRNWLLSEGEFIDEYSVKHLTDMKKAEELYDRKIVDYVSLSEEVRSNPKFLSKVIAEFHNEGGYDCNLSGYEYVTLGRANPICYAEEGALTEENIKAAIKKGCICITGYNAISRNRQFIIESLKSDYPAQEIIPQLVYIPLELKYDEEIATLINSRREGVKNIPSIIDKRSQLPYTLLTILSNGQFAKRDIVRSIVPYDGNDINIIEMIRSLKQAYPNSKQCNIFNDKDSEKMNPYDQGRLCSDNGIVVIEQYGWACNLYLPKSLSEEQFNLLVCLITEDYGDKKFTIDFDGYYSTYHLVPKAGGGYKNKSYSAVDVLKFIRENNLYPQIWKDVVPSLKPMYVDREAK